MPAIEFFLNRLTGVKPSREGWTAHCPAHADGTPSLSIAVGVSGKPVFKCHAGCPQDAVIAALGLTWAQILGDAAGDAPPRHSQPRNHARPSPEQSPSTVAQPGAVVDTQTPFGCTLNEYALAKGLPVDFLKSLRIRQQVYSGAAALRMAYLDRDGNEVAVRFRTALFKGKGDDKRFKWRKGSRPCLYGLWQLMEGPFVVLVEGESDSQTLWHHGINALGLPGAANWKEDRDFQHLDAFQAIYVVREPDKGGETLCRQLSRSKLASRIKVVTLGQFKDVSELHLAESARFVEQFEAAMAAAVPLQDLIVLERRLARDAAWRLCSHIATSPDVLQEAVLVLRRAGLVGEERNAKILFLSLVSRFLDHIVSLIIKGQSSTGKSYTAEQVLKLFPASAYYVMTASSDKALIYTNEDFKHRIIVMFEAAAWGDNDFAMYLIRSLLSEGRIAYDTVVDSPDGPIGKRIEKAGPTGLWTTTTATAIHPENETRLLTLNSDESADQIRRVLIAMAKARNAAPPDFLPWHAFQDWLALGQHHVEIPFGQVLAMMIPPVANRLRRDFKSVLSLIEGHALVHQANRSRSADGAIVATVDQDYAAVRSLLHDLVAENVAAGVPPVVRQTVSMAEKLIASGKSHVTVNELAEVLGVDKANASRRVKRALASGYLVNEESARGKPSKLRLGDPLPDDTSILPTVEALRAAMASGESSDPPQPPTGRGEAGSEQPMRGCAESGNQAPLARTVDPDEFKKMNWLPATGAGS